MSTIDTPPEDRQPVLTYVGPYDEGLALGAVRRELLREGQVFWVHNRVATIDRQAAWLQEQLPDARVVVAHGQMDEADLEKQMMKFWDREADVLVCSVIIESGLDVPNANTLIVDSRAPARPGADVPAARARRALHRAGVRATSSSRRQRELTEEAHERLATISKHQSLGQRVPDRAAATWRSAAPGTCSARSSTATSRRSGSTRTAGSWRSRSPR